LEAERAKVEAERAKAEKAASSLSDLTPRLRPR
jgi:hypothetical protein